MIDQLDMDPSEMPLDEDFSEWIAGNKVIKGSIPLSHRYGGYQFGYWARQLGDGRAILLGEYVNAKGSLIDIDTLHTLGRKNIAFITMIYSSCY